MWKFPGGLSNPSENIGEYCITQRFQIVENFHSIVCNFLI